MATAFRITAFGGISPRTSPRLLPDNLGQVANNLKRSSGEIRPIASPSVVLTPAKTMPPLTMYIARTALLAPQWFSWPIDVDVVRGPFPVDVESRFYWTGDGEPRYATFSRATLSGLNDYPSNFWALGVPTPLTKPTVTPSGGTANTVSRVYCTTFFSELGEESGSSPVSDVVSGFEDATWAITGLDAVPPNSGDIVSLTYVGKRVTIGTTNNHYNRPGDPVTIAGVTTVSNVNGTWTLVSADAAAKTMTFDVTDAPTGTYNNTTDAADTWARVAPWNTTNMKRRLYRSAGTNATFQLVSDDVGTTYDDTLSDGEILGDELMSKGWEPPPAGLKCLRVHPSGALVGIVNNILRMSEPYQPHAWPSKYGWAAEHECVAIAVYGSQVAVGTKGRPYIASGVDPAAMSMEKAMLTHPCLSKRGMISIGSGALYASANGLILLGQGGGAVYTDPFYTRDEWEKLNPASMFLAEANGRVYAGHTDASGNTEILVFDGGGLTTVSVDGASLYADEATGDVYVGTPEGIALYDSNDAAPMVMTWRSKEYRLATPVNLGAAKIEFEQVLTDEQIAAMAAAYAAALAENEAAVATGYIGGEVNAETINQGPLVGGSFLPVLPDAAPSNKVSFTLYARGRALYSRTIGTEKPFRLPPGVKYDSFSIEVSSQNIVRSILVGETVDSLRVA